jgi:hypothetical protein
VLAVIWDIGGIVNAVSAWVYNVVDMAMTLRGVGTPIQVTGTGGDSGGKAHLARRWGYSLISIRGVKLGLVWLEVIEKERLTFFDFMMYKNMP